MNRYILFILSLFLLSSCSSIRDSRYRIQNDEFKNQSVISLIQYVKPSERRLGVSRLKITFQRRVGIQGDSLKAFVFVSRTESSFPVESKCFVKANGKTFERELKNQISEAKTSVSTETNTTTKDSITITSSESNTNQFYNDKFILSLDAEIVDAIAKTNKLIFRFYFGPEMATYKLSNYQLRRLNGLLKK